MEKLPYILILILSLCGCQHNRDKPGEKLLQPGVTFDHLVIDSLGVENPWAKICGDINGDGLSDIVIGGQKGPLVWYRNPDWQRFEIAAGGYNTVDGEAGDIDGDGDLDVVMGGLIWYDNPGNLRDDPSQIWEQHQIAIHPTHDVELADINNDGKLDIVTRNQSDFGTKKGNTIHIWTNPHSGDWKEAILECDHGEGLKLSDLDADGDTDIIGSGFWFENVATNEWPRHDITQWNASANVTVADLNGDKRLDIVLTPSELASQYYRISWFAQPEDIDEGSWTEHILIDSIECVIHGVANGDFNGDGAIDITYSEMHQGADPDEVVVLINGNHGEQWSSILLSKKGSHSIQVADMDGDKSPDIMGANWSGKDQSINLWLAKRKI
ncbi:MAG: VCBS repeat-containing protein [Saprospiraceae bacterium]|nr:VCBS repeat-containing protein [Saprospiraceae bacterium]